MNPIVNEPNCQRPLGRMGRLGFSAALVYGQGLFITISPSERHGGLAIKLSRYRECDPLLKGRHAKKEQKWIGKDKPSLETHDDRIGGDEPITRRESSSWRETLCALSRRSLYMSASRSPVCWASACAPSVHIATTERTLVRTSSAAMPRRKAALLDGATPYLEQWKRRRVESCTIT